MGASELPGWDQKGGSLGSMDTILLQNVPVSAHVVPATEGEILGPFSVEFYA